MTIKAESTMRKYQNAVYTFDKLFALLAEYRVMVPEDRYPRLEFYGDGSGEFTQKSNLNGNRYDTFLFYSLPDAIEKMTKLIRASK